jgi:putative Ca2+/H+ antiporter (TMEM165/GDT1 family)
MPATVLPPQPVLFPSLAGLDRAIGKVFNPSHEDILSIDFDPSASVPFVAMIIVSEIGDKTFLLAALLAMQHPRLIVFTGAFLALLVMSVLSAGLGHVLPTLISRQYTVLAASALFLVFGLKMLREGMEMEGGTGKVQEEIEEIEHEIREKGEDLEPEHARLEEARPTARSRQLTGRRGSIKRSRSQESKNGLKNLSYLLISPVLIQTFIMTFLAEWGDRSQISTIALAAAHVCSPILFSSFAIPIHWFSISYRRSLINLIHPLPSPFPIRIECLHRLSGHRPWSRTLYLLRRYGRSMVSNKNFGQVRSVIFDLF